MQTQITEERKKDKIAAKGHLRGDTVIVHDSFFRI